MILQTQIRLALTRIRGLSVTSHEIVALIVVLGLVFRVCHFLQIPSIWHDEAAVVVNILQLDYRQLYGPLLHHEAAPPLFMMVEKLVAHLLGDSLVILRLFPFLASCASLILLTLLAWRVLPRDAVPWAVAFFAFSDRLLEHSVEAKPYAIDVFVAVLVAYGYVVTRSWSLGKQCLLALPVFPIMIWLSFPACFVIGGWFLAQVPALLRCRSLKDWSAALLLAAVVAVAFLTLLFGPIRAQTVSQLEGCWVNGFPNWSRPWSVPLWALTATYQIFNYAISPIGGLMSGFVVFSAIVWSRTEKRTLLTLLLAPLGLVFLAALLGKYPYCGLRVLVFITPAICLLAGAGAANLLAWLKSRSIGMAIALGLILALPALEAVWRTMVPLARPDLHAATRYVNEHWQAGDGVGFNSWEGEYEFRDRKNTWHDTIAPKSAPPKRYWYVWNSKIPGDHDKILRHIPSNWTELERKRFQFVSVILYQPE